METIKIRDLSAAVWTGLFFIGFSLLNMSEFFVFRKTETYETDNHPLCGCATIVIQKITFPVIIEVSSHY